MSDHYFTFPLRILREPSKTPTALQCLELIVDVGVLNAGIGYRRKHGEDAFNERLEEILQEKDLEPFYEEDTGEDILVGAELCGVNLGSYEADNLWDTFIRASNIRSDGALVTMRTDFVWAALDAERWKAGRAKEFPSQMISWAEFRVLCAILSSPLCRAGYTTIGWESIASRACGFTSREEFERCENLPDHVAPPLSRKQIRKITDTLEELQFFARFRIATGARGGRMAYSFRHTREELAAAVCADVNFRDRSKVTANREDDARKCLRLLERANSGANSDTIQGHIGNNSGTTGGPTQGPSRGPT